MPRITEDPVKTLGTGPNSEMITTHPAYAQIGVSRVTGHRALYDSDFAHSHFMTIRICKSELHRSLSRDWHFGRDEIIEVALSESQWATFVSSPNVGSGVPCTLAHFNGKQVPGLPDPSSRVEQFDAEIEVRMAKCLALIERAESEVAATGLSKAKQAPISDRLAKIKQELTENLPFVANQFSEHMETTVEKAKQEVHGYMVNTLRRAGLDALTKGELPLQITAEKKED